MPESLCARSEKEFMKVLLFAAGISTRWKGPRLGKHLSLVAGVPVLVRTLGQLSARDVESTVITYEPELAALAPSWYSPPSSRWCNTFLHSREIWEGRVIAMHADVVWDDKALDIVLDSAGLGFYGTRKGPWENFAAVFDPEHYERMKRAARIAQKHKGDRSGTWEIYRALVGIPLNNLYTFENVVWNEVKESLKDDFTCDFDTVEKYENFLKANPWART